MILHHVRAERSCSCCGTKCQFSIMILSPSHAEVTVMFQQPSFAATEVSRFVRVCMVATGSNLTRSVMVLLNTRAGSGSDSATGKTYSL